MARKKTSRTKETNTTPEHDPVIARLEGFHILPDPKIRTGFRFLPALLVLLVLTDWLVGGGNFSRDTFRMTGVLTVAVILIGIQILFDRFPRALETIWRRGLIDVQVESSEQNPFLAYIDEFDQALDAKYEWIVSLVCAVGALLATYPFRYFAQANRFPFDLPGMLVYYFGGQAAVIAPILGIIVGILIWRVGVIAVFIGRIGERFTLKIQVNHQDQCGGLKPIGDLAFYIAVIILIPSIFLAVWGFITTIFDNPALQLYITLWGGLFHQLLVVLGLFSLLAFIQPLYRIHMRMIANAKLVQDELDGLSKKIEALSLELRSQADVLPPDEGEEKLRAIEFMKKVYEENSKIPTWPFDWNTILRFVSAQVIPLLSLFGTSGPMVDIVKGIFSLTQ